MSIRLTIIVAFDKALIRFHTAVMFQLGPYELHSIVTGQFRLDGGAMFGVVPRVLWERERSPDALNRISLAMRTLLVLDAKSGRVLIVDTGAGTKWTAEEMDRFAFEFEGDPLGSGLKRHGLSDDDVTDVVVTHLHFDHNGGLTISEDHSKEHAKPRFRKARHWIHARHLAHACNPTPKDRASFYSCDFKPIMDAGLFRMLEGDNPASDIPGIHWQLAWGHTPYQLLPRFVAGSQSLQYMGDLIPTSAHLPIPWVMAYDNEPLRTLEEKKKVLRDCFENDLILFFEHDPSIAAARIDTSGKRPRVREVVEL